MTIKDIRTATGLSQARFAAITGIPRRTLEDWERGLRTPPKWLPAMLEAFLREHGYPIEKENLKGEKKVYYHITKDGQLIGRTSTEEEAIEMIRGHQKYETHYMLRSSYGYLRSEDPTEIIVGYDR